MNLRSCPWCGKAVSIRYNLGMWMDDWQVVCPEHGVMMIGPLPKNLSKEKKDRALESLVSDWNSQEWNEKKGIWEERHK